MARIVFKTRHYYSPAVCICSRAFCNPVHIYAFLDHMDEAGLFSDSSIACAARMIQVIGNCIMGNDGVTIHNCEGHAGFVKLRIPNSGLDCGSWLITIRKKKTGQHPFNVERLTNQIGAVNDGWLTKSEIKAECVMAHAHDDYSEVRDMIKEYNMVPACEYVDNEPEASTAVYIGQPTFGL